MREGVAGAQPIEKQSVMVLESSGKRTRAFIVHIQIDALNQPATSGREMRGSHSSFGSNPARALGIQTNYVRSAAMRVPEHCSRSASTRVRGETDHSPLVARAAREAH